jgi:hypothetical protein
MRVQLGCYANRDAYERKRENARRPPFKAQHAVGRCFASARDARVVQTPAARTDALHAQSAKPSSAQLANP